MFAHSGGLGKSVSKSMADREDVSGLALFWQNLVSEPSTALRTPRLRRRCEQREERLSDGGQAWMAARLSVAPLFQVGARVRWPSRRQLFAGGRKETTTSAAAADALGAEGEVGADGGGVEQGVQRQLVGGRRLWHVGVPVLEARRARLSGDSREIGDVRAARQGRRRKGVRFGRRSAPGAYQEPCRPLMRQRSTWSIRLSA